MVGFFAFLVAVSVLIPFPGTNFPPSIALVIASIAVMEEDGYLLIVGYLIGLAGLAYTATVLGASYPPHPGRHAQPAEPGSGSKASDFRRSLDRRRPWIRVPNRTASESLRLPEPSAVL